MEALSEFYSDRLNDELVDWGVATYTVPGQTLSGDRHVVCPYPNGVLIAAVDGVGHGQEAAAAAEQAATILTERIQESDSVIALFKECHAQLSETRGVVMSLAMINAQDGAMTWMGVGNVECMVVRASSSAGPRIEPLLLRGGVVGSQLPSLYASIVPIQPGDTLILATDGVRNDFAHGLNVLDEPQQIAERVLTQHRKGSDDALVLVARYRG
jgi:serine phosphatase RsbU (regulator of sigma subunit)